MWFLKSRLNGLYAFLLHPVIGGCHRNRCRHFNQPADDALPQPVYQVGGTVVAGDDRRQLCFVPSVDEYEELLAYPVAWLFTAQVVQDQYVYGPGAIDNGLGGSGGIRIVIPRRMLCNNSGVTTNMAGTPFRVMVLTMAAAR